MCKASKLYLPFQKILPLSDSEKLVLSKGLNFVPISEKTDEFLVKQEVEKFLRRVQLKAFFARNRVILTPLTEILSHLKMLPRYQQT